MEDISLSMDDEKLLAEYGLSPRAIAMLKTIGKRYRNHTTAKQDLEKEFEKIGMVLSGALFKFQETFAGLQYSAPRFVDSRTFEHTHNPRDPSNRVLGAYFGIGLPDEAPKISQDELVLVCGSIWNDDKVLFVSREGWIYYPGEDPQAEYPMVRVANSLVPFLEHEAFLFENLETLPKLYRYLFNVPEAMKAIEVIRSSFTDWNDLEPGYSIATRDDCAFLVGRNWGAPNDEWELIAHVPRQAGAHPLVKTIETFEFIGRVEGEYTVERGWQ